MSRYDEDRKFSGILYMHNISDPKVGGSSQRTMAMFKTLCGPDPLKNVVVVTTFWDQIELLQDIEFETELKTKDKLFKGLVEGKSKFVRYGKFPPGEIPTGPKFLPPISIVNELVVLDLVFVEMQKPSGVVTFAFRLAHAISSAWDVVIVKGEEDLEKARAKMFLYECARDVLGSALRWLSIKPLERM